MVVHTDDAAAVVCDQPPYYSVTFAELGEGVRQVAATAYDIADDIQKATHKPVAVVNIRESGGLIAATERALRYAADFARQLSDLKREPMPLANLLFGVECSATSAASRCRFPV